MFTLAQLLKTKRSGRRKGRPNARLCVTTTRISFLLRSSTAFRSFTFVLPGLRSSLVVLPGLRSFSIVLPAFRSSLVLLPGLRSFSVVLSALRLRKHATKNENAFLFLSPVSLCSE
jgi:hypothetical protein